ncbi:class I SAM-dependent methyltransferase [Nitrosospira multiformis]|uniref:class I SAM-dependent methyltransferase n=1 Tax=Nitrosospira multiformis TaxID=1231 RepID=UPI00089D02D0|nr:class I SAM-dependent methyltransferase [Nitrosospira multiformis]SEA43240.1 Methyltransferase domain-containing protein [Nitrosospira multiformis]
MNMRRLLQLIGSSKTNAMTFEEYLSDIPHLHTWDGGKTWNTGGFQRSHLEAFHRLVTRYKSDGTVVLETGAGNSTLAFAFAKPSQLISIAPDDELFSRINTFGIQNGVDLSCLDAKVDRSERVLPKLVDSGLEVDVALIDGGHGWPTVFVDFCYVNFMLRKEGLLIIDDVQLHSIKELAKLLVQQDQFDLKENLGKSLVFIKKSDWKFLPDWQDEPYIVMQSQKYSMSDNPFSPT